MYVYTLLPEKSLKINKAYMHLIEIWFNKFC